MKFKIAIFLQLYMFSMASFAFDLGISSSGNDIAIDTWSQQNESDNWGGYFRAIADFGKYKNGTNVSVCSDGSISGSFGSGTCSGHGGVSHTKEAEFDRYALVFGPSYWIARMIQIHGGLIVGMYSSNINIGDKRKKDFTKYGLDFGISLKPIERSGVKFVISHETEQNRTLFGIRFPI